MAFKLDGFATEADLARALKRATRRAAEAALPVAIENAPVDTGELRDSGEVNDAYNPRLGIAESSVDFTAEHASFVEDGSFNIRADRYIAGTLFLQNALDQTEDELDAETKRELEKLGAKRVRKTSF